jgi:hypothetical protein
MVFLEFEDSGQSEDELLLPRGSRFQVWSSKQITENRRMQNVTRASAFYTKDWQVLHVYYTRLFIGNS